MAKIDLSLVQKLREITGLGMMDCKKALEQAEGDMDGAIDILRKKGAAVAARRADKETAEGLVHAYIHPGAQVGVLIALSCETDFVARTDAMKQLAQDLCMHIAAYRPLYLNSEQVDPKFLEHERMIAREQLAGAGKPEKIIEQIIDGKIKKLFTEICLVEQPFIKDDERTVGQVVEEVIAKTGENIKIKHFARFEVGV